MKNLAGVSVADAYIRRELGTAGIEIIEGPLAKGEVPYTLTGKIGNWTFERAWNYWMANSSERKTGLPLDIAEKLHDKKYKIEGSEEPETYGQVIRVQGHCGCPPPKDWARPAEGLGIDKKFVDNYHIDTQKGLNEFVRTLVDSFAESQI